MKILLLLIRVGTINLKIILCRKEGSEFFKIKLMTINGNVYSSFRSKQDNIIYTSEENYANKRHKVFTYCSVE